jgi:predicted ATPase
VTDDRPFIGRHAEIAALEAAWEAARSGNPRIVVVTGEPGVGKSRLAQRARDMMGGGGREVRAQCSPNHTGTAFHPLVAALTETWGLRTAGGSQAAIARVRAEVATIAGAPAGSASLFLEVLGLPPSPRYDDPVLAPETARRRTMDAIIGWLGAASAQTPVLLLIEDLHWADASTLSFTAALVDELETGHLLVVVTARPPVAVPPMQTERIVPLALAPLDADETGALIDAIAGGTTLGAVARAEIIERTNGIPLFVEKLTRALVDPGAPGATLHDLLTARLDRLGTAKDVAQVAATLGTTFPFVVLDAVGPARGYALRAELDRLAAAELIEPAPTGGYRFRHALIRDAAYESQSVEQRCAVHGRVADALATHFPDIVAAQPEVMAYHLDEAGREAESAAHWCRAVAREVGALVEATA